MKILFLFTQPHTSHNTFSIKHIIIFKNHILKGGYYCIIKLNFSLKIIK